MFIKFVTLFNFFVFIVAQNKNESFILNEIIKATCDTEFQVVPLKHAKINRDNQFQRLSPSCVRILQCSGCCKNGEKCEATRSIRQEYKVNLIDSLRKPTVETVNAFVYKHEACECKCKITAKDCTKQQYFNEKECACECPNYAKEKCQIISKSYSKTFHWNEDTCSCDCIRPPCTTGFHLNEICECVANNSK